MTRDARLVATLALALTACGKRPLWEGSADVLAAFGPPPKIDLPCNGPACETACQRGNAFACVHRANELQVRLDARLDRRITELLIDACRGGDGQGCLELAVHCGRKVADDRCDAAAMGLLSPEERERCAKTGAPECLTHAREAQQVEGYSRATSACRGGVPRACFLSGYARRAGYGVIQDAAEALVYFRYGCTVGDPNSCDSLASLLRVHGSKIGDPAKDPAPDYEADSAEERAIQLFEEACRRADALACTTLADRYADGTGGVSEDAELSAEMRVRACNLGLDDRRCP